MCREVLQAKGTLENRNGQISGFAYRWDSLPGKHDFLDTHAMAFAAAGYEGVLADIETKGQSIQRSERIANNQGRNRRKVFNG
jgi:hypothetical protein